MIPFIPRAISAHIQARLKGAPRKIILLYGQRQVGKTTMAEHLLSAIGEGRVLRINGDINLHTEVFSSRSLEKLRLFTGGYDYLLVDEAQRIPDIGINLKILHDNIPDLRIIVTGSASLDLANRVHEPLTGRTWTFRLYPFSAAELAGQFGNLSYHNRLEEWLIYGAYPGVLELDRHADKAAFLSELTQAYLYKDILEIGGIRHSGKFRDLLRLLAFQIGSEVSFNELGRQLGLDTATVQRYVDLLEQSFVLKTVSGYSRNLRKEISKKQKIYFEDLGVRNAVIEQFSPLSYRNDQGALWENFLFIERAKLLNNAQIRARQYFWRLQSGAEIDYVESRNERLNAFEFKWGRQTAKAPLAWTESYPHAGFETVHQDNWLPFVLDYPTESYG